MLGAWESTVNNEHSALYRPCPNLCFYLFHALLIDYMLCLLML